MNLLSIDWDFFTMRPWEMRLKDVEEQWGALSMAALMQTDWGHKEAPFFIDSGLWYSRAGGLIESGVGLIPTTGEEVGFWNRVTLAPDATLYVAESHSNIATLLNPYVEEVVNYDAHHDAGYKEVDLDELVGEGTWHCDDWAILARYGFGSRVRVVYPRWKARSWRKSEPWSAVKVERMVDNGKPDPRVYDQVFICRSGAWTPPWLDEAFQAFVDACPVAEITDNGLVDRTWEPVLLEREMEVRRQVRAGK